MKLTAEATARVRNAVDQYAEQNMMTDEPLDTVITDMVVDLLHLADTVDPDSADDAFGRVGGTATLERAAMHYGSES